MNPYDTLGVTPEASDKDIKTAYRKAAHKTHPDRDGGDAEAFHDIALAYDILSDPGRRQRYDQTGDTQDEAKPRLSRAETTLVTIFNKIIDDGAKGDIVGKVRDIIAHGRAVGKQERRKTQGRISRLEKLQDRVDAKGDNLFAMTLEHKLGDERHHLESIESELTLSDEIEELLDGYCDNSPDTEPAFQSIGGFGQSGLFNPGMFRQF